VIEPTIVVVRLLQYAGATILLGSSLFFVYAFPRSGPHSNAMTRGARPLVALAAAVLAVASMLGIAAQASRFAGSFAEGFTLDAMTAVATYMDLGKAAVVRSAAAVVAVAVMFVLPRGRANWVATSAFGAICTASLAWMGHAAATEGPLGGLHLASDAIHALAAAIWIGALVGFSLLLMRPPRTAEGRDALHAALQRFSGIGLWVVAILVLTGAINGWILVGFVHAADLLETPYGRLLTLKLVLFLAMLALAAANRFRLAPALATVGPPGRTELALGRLRRSVAWETVAGLAVLALVAWLGTLAPRAG